MRQTLALQHLAQARAVAGQDKQFAVIAVPLLFGRLQPEGSLVEQLLQPRLGIQPQLVFLAALRTAELGRVDVGNADLAAVIVELIAVDYAGLALPPPALAEIARFGVARCSRGGSVKHPGQTLRPAAQGDHRGKHRQRQRHHDRADPPPAPP